MSREDLFAVIIGRNEGSRLKSCLESVRREIERVVYVDSGSIDGSAELAESYGVDVVRLHEGPYTAARGRNAGLEHAGRVWPGLSRVFFIDGDCTLAPGFLERAGRALDEHPDVVAVCARRREERPDENLWHRLVDMDWDIPPGDVPYTGGDFLARLEPILEAGGWSAELIAGEEPDLCFRLRDRGHRILRLEGEMTRHDVAMAGIGAYLRRSIRSGHAYAEVGLKHRKGSGKRWFRAAISIAAYGFLLPAAVVAGTVAFGPPALLLLLPYPVLVLRLFLSCRRRGYSIRDSLAYAALNAVGKFTGFWGMMRFFIGRAVGRRTRLIEYGTKETAKSAKGTGESANVRPEGDH